MDRMYKYVILGGGRAALSAAEGIREEDGEGSILMISAEDVPAYSRPMLTKTPLRSYELSRTFVKDGAWYAENGIELLLGTEVRSIDNSSRKVETERGSCFYSKLIYALGGSCFVPPIKGADLPQVKVIREYRDIYDIKRFCVECEDVVIIGGGVIGLEAGFELSRYGMNVTVLEALPSLMPRFLDAESAASLQNSISSFKVHTGVNIEEIGGKGRVEFVRLSDGRVFKAGCVVISAGVRANTALAKASGIKCGGAVMINERCETFSKDIYACGDCAEYEGTNYQLWSQAQMQGRVAGVNAAGGKARIEPFDSSMVINSPEISMFSCGDVGKDPGISYDTRVEENMQPALFAVNERFARSYEKRFYAGGKLVGAIIVGNLSDMQGLKEEILGIRPKEVR